jgi:predicted RNA-binding protein associated with RNAse of E/G family
LARNAGLTVDTVGQRVCDRDGHWYPVDRLITEGQTLYYARPVPFDTITYHERWLIAYANLSFSRFTFRDEAPHKVDWYIEPDIIEVEGHFWRVKDGFIDLEVYEGSHYRLDDADELADGLLSGDITPQEAAAVLFALDRLCEGLRDHGHSGAQLLALFAPGLPR